MHEIVIHLYQVMFAIGIFVLISLGLAVIFGMMRVINLAQGEFIMLGAYFCLFATQLGLDFWLAVLCAGLGVGLFGILVERLLIRFLYGRIMDTLLATWGLSLFMVGLVTSVFGPQEAGVDAKLGKVTFGAYSIAEYNLVLIAVAGALLALTFAIWRYTRFGLVARSVMQNPTMAAALGVNPRKYYMLTFGFGSALTGVAGAMLAPLVGNQPTMGSFYVAKAFVTVISGGPAPLTGTLYASTLFGATDGLISYRTTQVLGEIGVLLIAIVLLRMLPLGITGHSARRA
ncbi:urea ABC transporter permease subunit UrtB [Paralimibaculum aggregatum]|uniref:Urea ABC transporter permease subunit UrtB n=1 Tax=Paralimibaculum aggregatum TaxID=3036245 RepID=A0ABQ6LIM7_9RHOB|nr:branched-chain amino acid ABC transporter permease [Limibaculum sp. NKW23]GMG81517.1 urea ABC transporter permease subunit UrtB [Limibaculum sp. NKW23]